MGAISAGGIGGRETASPTTVNSVALCVHDFFGMPVEDPTSQWPKDAISSMSS